MKLQPVAAPTAVASAVTGLAPAAAPRRLALLWLCFALFSLWIRAGFPLVALGGAGADDALFIRLAGSLIRGQWLGRYDDLTLAKGMFYPLFIAATAFTAIPLKIAEHAVYLAIAWATASYVGRQSRSPWLGTVLFVALAFNPVFWDRQLARVIREGLYDSLSLAVVVLATGVCCSQARLARRALLGVALGLLAGAFWLTREEGVWLLPALASVVVAAIAAVLSRGLDWRARLRRLADCAIPLAVAALLFAGAVGSVAWLNGRNYGNVVTNEFKSHAFQRAYGALAGIRQDHWRRYVVFPHDARLRAYAVSPAARELEPFFEGHDGESWRSMSCGQFGLDRAACPDILAGWFMWALRDAVSSAGHANSARDARRFYQRLADEIDAACDDGTLPCVAARRATLAPPFRWHYLADAWQRASTVAGIVFTLGGGNMETPRSEGMQPELAAFADIAGPFAPLTGPVEQRITGWVAAASGLPSLAVQAGPGVTTSVMNVLSGADVEAVYPGLTAMRFELVSSCHPGTCSLVVSAPGELPVVLPWAQLAPTTMIASPTERMYLESVANFDAAGVTSLRRHLQRSCAAAIYPLYRYAFPILSALGAIGLAFAAARRAIASLPIFTLAVASLIAVACRIALLSYLDVTSIPAANSLYASPAAPFVIVAAILGVHTGLTALRRNRRTAAGIG